MSGRVDLWAGVIGCGVLCVIGFVVCGLQNGPEAGFGQTTFPLPFSHPTHTSKPLDAAPDSDKTPLHTNKSLSVSLIPTI